MSYVDPREWSKSEPPGPRRVLSPPRGVSITEGTVTPPSTRLSSIAPAAIAEAKSTRFQVSLFLLIALVAISYYVGRDAGRGLAKADMAQLQAKQTEQLAQIIEALNHLKELQQRQLQTTASQDTRLHALQAQLEVVRSHITERR